MNDKQFMAQKKEKQEREAAKNGGGEAEEVVLFSTFAALLTWATPSCCLSGLFERIGRVR